MAIVAVLLGDIAGDRVADPDAADQQRGEADQAQKKRDAIDQPLQRRRGFAKAADLPAGLGKGGARRVAQAAASVPGASRSR